VLLTITAISGLIPQTTLSIRHHRPTGQLIASEVTDKDGGRVDTFIAEYAWIVWLVLILIFITIEMVTLELTFLMIALGSLGGLLSGLLGAPWWLQLVIAAVLAVVLLFGIKPPLLRALKKGGDPTRSNVDALLGLDGQVVSSIGTAGGQVRLANGETWTARLSPVTEQRVVEPGERVLVTEIDGATAVVVPAERNVL
jgi:membrane protein implicated in regulation of membrane protease activity